MVLWKGFLYDLSYASLWSTFLIFLTATTGARQLKYNGEMIIYAIMSGVSIVTSIAGTVMLFTRFNFDYLNIVVMIAVIFNIPVASAAIHYVKKLQSSPNISTSTTLNTE